jgi:hypothetical protein
MVPQVGGARTTLSKSEPITDIAIPACQVLLHAGSTQW